MNDLAEALKYANNLFQRGALGIAAALYAIFVVMAPSVTSRADIALAAASGQVVGCQAILLTTDQKWVLGTIFALDAVGIFWRIFDPVARLWWGRAVNLGTACLWATVTGATLFTYGRPLPDAVGEIMLTLTALYTLTRTDFTARDRRAV